MKTYTPVFAPGTKSPSTAVAPGWFTDKQYAGLDPLKQVSPPTAKGYGCARIEFVNKVLLPDGSVSTDLSTVRAALRGALALMATAAGIGAEPTEDEAELAGRAVAAEQHAVIMALSVEFEGHVAQKRFLIVVDAVGLPHTYFQCATMDNPDVRWEDEARNTHFHAAIAKRLAKPQPHLVTPPAA